MKSSLLIFLVLFRAFALIKCAKKARGNAAQTSSLDDESLYSYNNLSALMALNPQVARNVDVTLYTLEQRSKGFTVTASNTAQLPLIQNGSTKIIIHGWVQNAGKSWVSDMRDALLQTGSHNIVTVDWNLLAKLEYTISARKTREIGAYLGQVLINFISAGLIRVQDIHIIGHSLGAHIAGIMAKTIRAYKGEKIGRITGLDPARPLFEWPLTVNRKKRLDKRDAMFVDVIHTSGGRLGVANPLGHADFYPNGGKSPQPGCSLLTQYVCSHGRAFKYYIESITTDKFKAKACDSWENYKAGKCIGNQTVVMGHLLNLAVAKGNYFLKTNRKSPYAMG